MSLAIIIKLGTERLPTQVERKRGDDVKSSLTMSCVGPHTHNTSPVQRQLHCEVVRIRKLVSVRLESATDSMKLESAVIAHQPWRGEYCLCTLYTARQHGSLGYLKSVTVASCLGKTSNQAKS